MAKKYELKIENCSGEDCQFLISKGHHDFDDFYQAAKVYWGEPFDKFWENPEHVWYRCVPDSTGNLGMLYVDAVPNSKGAFPATVMCRP